MLGFGRTSVKAISQSDDLALARVERICDQPAERSGKLSAADLFQNIVFKGDNVHQAQITAEAICLDRFRKRNILRRFF